MRMKIGNRDLSSVTELIAVENTDCTIGTIELRFGDGFGVTEEFEGEAEEWGLEYDPDRKPVGILEVCWMTQMGDGEECTQSVVYEDETLGTALKRIRMDEWEATGRRVTPYPRKEIPFDCYNALIMEDLEAFKAYAETVPNVKYLI